MPSKCKKCEQLKSELAKSKEKIRTYFRVKRELSKGLSYREIIDIANSNEPVNSVSDVFTDSMKRLEVSNAK